MRGNVCVCVHDKVYRNKTESDTQQNESRKLTNEIIKFLETKS
jgi:hypothetical protein